MSLVNTGLDTWWIGCNLYGKFEFGDACSMCWIQLKKKKLRLLADRRCLYVSKNFHQQLDWLWAEISIAWYCTRVKLCILLMIFKLASSICNIKQGVRSQCNKIATKFCIKSQYIVLIFLYETTHEMLWMNVV